MTNLAEIDDLIVTAMKRVVSTTETILRYILDFVSLGWVRLTTVTATCSLGWG